MRDSQGCRYQAPCQTSLDYAIDSQWFAIRIFLSLLVQSQMESNVLGSTKIASPPPNKEKISMLSKVYLE